MCKYQTLSQSNKYQMLKLWTCDGSCMSLSVSVFQRCTNLWKTLSVVFFPNISQFAVLVIRWCGGGGMVDRAGTPKPLSEGVLETRGRGLGL